MTNLIMATPGLFIIRFIWRTIYPDKSLIHLEQENKRLQMEIIRLRKESQRLTNEKRALTQINEDLRRLLNEPIDRNTNISRLPWETYTLTA